MGTIAMTRRAWRRCMPLSMPALRIDPKHFQLISPYESDPRKWSRLPWIDRQSGKRFAVTTRPSTQPDVVHVKSYADVLAEYEAHPEDQKRLPDSAHPRQARGLLPRRHVRMVPDKVSYIGKESNRLEEVVRELEHCLEDVQEVYKKQKGNSLGPLVFEALKKIPSRELARIAGVSERAIRAIRNGHSKPKPGVLNSLKKALKSKER